MPVYSIWAGEESGITLKQGPDKPTHPGDADAELVMVFEAADWDEAVQRQYDHYGWGYYRPMDREDER